MSTWDGNNYYYSGQGVVLLGDRDATGKPKGLIPVGNVSDLKISVSTSVVEHKESQTGSRGIDLRLTTETKANLSMTMENFDSVTLAAALRGTRTEKAASAVVAEAVKWYGGKVMPLKYVKVDTVLVKRGATSLVAYTNDSTPYDYKLNADAGSIMLNDGSMAVVSAITTGGVAPSAISVGTTTSVTVANTAVVGDKVVFTGFAGADAALVNGKVATIVTASSTVVTININTLGKTITIGTPLSCFDGQALAVDYNFAGQNLIDALMTSTSEKYLRFEGLNTADGNNPVVVEIFKFSTDPLKELALIGDGIGQHVLDGNVLADTLQTSGSKFFKQTLLR